MGKIWELFQLLAFTFIFLFLTNIAAVSAQEGLLDDKVFVGQSKEKHIRAIEKDELRFVKGKFFSKVYSKKGFNKGMYTATTQEDKIYFEAENLHPKQGKIKWRGIVQGNSIDVNYQWIKRGWLSDTIKDFSFNGVIKN
jgi:hypothetical protein